MNRCVTLVILIVIVPFRVFACDLHTVYTLPPVEDSPIGFFGGVSQQFTHFGTLQESDNRITDIADQHLNSSITQFLVGYEMNTEVSVQLNIPYIVRSFRRADEDEIDTGTVSGFGDISLVARGLVWEELLGEVRITAHGLLGVKFPTGDAERLREETEEDHHHAGHPESGIHGHDLTLGSGSFDVLVGGTFMGEWDHFFVTVNLQYFVRTNGRFDYRFANDIRWVGGPGVYFFSTEETNIAFQLIVSGEHKGKDKFQGEKADDTAVTFVYVGPQISASYGKNIHSLLGVDLPVIRENSAVQMVPDVRVRGAVTVRF